MGSVTVENLSASHHLSSYNNRRHEREEENHFPGQGSQEGESVKIAQSENLNNSHPFDGDSANDLALGDFGGFGGGGDLLTTAAPFPDNNPSPLHPPFGREALNQEPNQSFGKGSSYHPINANSSVQNLQTDRWVGQNLNMDLEEASRFVERPLEPPQGKVDQLVGPSGNSSAIKGPSVNPSGDFAPRGPGKTFGGARGAPPNNVPGPSPFPPPPAPPAVIPVGPVPHPVNPDPPSSDGDGPPLEETPTLSVLYGKVFHYGGTAFKAHFGCAFDYDSSSGRKVNIKGLFNIGTDIGKSPHEPNLLQGHGPFGNVKAKFGDKVLDYEIGKISGIKYNKVSCGVPLNKLFPFLPGKVRLHAVYYTENRWFPVPTKIKTNFFCGLFSDRKKEKQLPGGFLCLSINGTGGIIAVPFTRSANNFSQKRGPTSPTSHLTLQKQLENIRREQQAAQKLIPNKMDKLVLEGKAEARRIAYENLAHQKEVMDSQQGIHNGVQEVFEEQQGSNKLILEKVERLAAIKRPLVRKLKKYLKSRKEQICTFWIKLNNLGRKQNQGLSFL